MWASADDLLARIIQTHRRDAENAEKTNDSTCVSYATCDSLYSIVLSVSLESGSILGVLRVSAVNNLG